jgi:ribose/xylose/arabinose/galactoside ABC-type transport system permease subunit
MNHVQAKSGLLPGRAALGPTYGALLALILLVFLNLAFTQNFAAWNNLWNILLQVTPTMLVAVGMTFVIATGGIDLSVGSVMAVASALAAINLELGVGVAILLALSVSLALGAFNGALIAGFGIQPFIVTLAMMISGRGIAQVISRGGQLIPFSNPAFEYLGKGYVGPMPFQVLVMLLLIAAAIFLLRVTGFGRYLLAVGGNQAAARLSGIRVHRTKIAVYAISGSLAGLAGLVEAARLGASDAARVGLNIELDAIAAVVVGGTPLSGGRATVLGTVVGALIMQVLTTSFNMGPLGLSPLPFSWSLVSKATIIVLAVYIQRPKAA